jgi:hypothetical protein
LNVWWCTDCGLRNSIASGKRNSIASQSEGVGWYPARPDSKGGKEGDNYFLHDHEVEDVGLENTKKLLMQIDNERERTAWLKKKVQKEEDKSQKLIMAIVILSLILLGFLAA